MLLLASSSNCHIKNRKTISKFSFKNHTCTFLVNITISVYFWVILVPFPFLVKGKEWPDRKETEQIRKSKFITFVIFSLFDLLLFVYRAGHRSFRGSVKIKQTYEHLKENGDLGTMNRTSASRRAPDIDIKLLQAKRQQAEMRRYNIELSFKKDSIKSVLNSVFF